MTPNNDIATEIDIACARRGLRKRKALAAKVGISDAHLSSLMNGKGRWTPGMLKRFIKALGIKGEEAQRWNQIGAKAAGWQI